MGRKMRDSQVLRTVNSYALFSGYFEAVLSPPQQNHVHSYQHFSGQMFRPVDRFTSYLFTHKANDHELESAIDTFYFKPGTSVTHRTRRFGNYRITTIRTTYEHPTSEKLIRH
jgi:hypothetical protein